MGRLARTGDDLAIDDAATSRSETSAGTATGTPSASSVVVAGIAVGTVEVALAASFATLIWSGPLAVHLPQGIGLGLFGAMVVLAGIALLGTLPGTLGSTQDIPAAILAVAVPALVTGLPAASSGTFLTVVMAIAATSLAVGGCFWLLGRFRLGRLVRYMPYPVVGGFLGGTGVLLAIGAFSVLTDAGMTLGTLGALLEPAAAARWLPGLAFAVALLVISRRELPAALFPVAFVGAIAAYHLVRLVTGTDIAAGQRGGWLLGPFEAGGMWQPWTLTAAGQVDWGAIAGQAPTLGTVAVFAAMGLLLNAGGIEVASRADVDLDRELRAAGVANIVAGLGGGPPGYHAVSLTALAHQMRAEHRAVGLVAAGLCAIVLVVGADMLAVFPRFVIGGLLLFVGVSMVLEWLVDTWQRLPRGEYLILVLIVAVITGWGFVAGVVLGLAAAVILFLVTYSRVSVTRHAFTAREYRSNVDRSPADVDALRRLGDQVQVLALQGYLFFGTANALYEQVRARVQDGAAPPLRHLVLSFRHVSGLDSSAVQSFEKIRTLADAHDFQVVVTDVGPRLRPLLHGTGLDDGKVQTLPDVDRGVEWCEDRLLAAHPPSGTDPGPDDVWFENTDGLDVAALEPLLERVDVPAGHVLLRQGDRSDDLYVLVSGRLTTQVELEDGGTLRLRTILPGSVVGELGMYLETSRTASVRADVPSTLHRLTRESLTALERERPDVAARLHAWLARLMARRITDDVRSLTALLR